VPHTIATQNEKSDTKIEEYDGKHNEGSKRQSATQRPRPANNKQDEKDGK
jgi:hypothetical protein